MNDVIAMIDDWLDEHWMIDEKNLAAVREKAMMQLVRNEIVMLRMALRAAKEEGEYPR